MRSLHERRIENEWRLLCECAKHNAGSLEVCGRSHNVEVERFHLVLKHTPALIGTPPALQIMARHEVTLQMPEFFPAVPLQAFLTAPVFHPNVHPVTGFVCLWDRTSIGDNVIDAVRRLQSVISWHLFNPSSDHLMQPDAIRLRTPQPSLPYQVLVIPPEFETEFNRRWFWNKRPRPRLTRIENP